LTAWPEIQRGCPYDDKSQRLEVLLAGVVEGVRLEAPVVGAVVLPDKAGLDEKEVGHAQDLPQSSDQVGVALGPSKPRLDDPQDTQPRFADRA